MKLTNRTVLIIGNELFFTLSLIKHLSTLNNKIVVISHIPSIFNQISLLFPHVIIINLNIYEDVDRTGLIEELSSRFLSPSCVIYNEFSFSKETLNYFNGAQLQEGVETSFTSLTHMDELLLSYLETEADATIAYILPNAPILISRHYRLLGILKRTIVDYIKLISSVYPTMRFISIKHPLKHTDANRLMPNYINNKKLDKLTKKFISSLELYTES